MLKETNCWLCNSAVFYNSNKELPPLNPEDLMITDSKYGNSLQRVKCEECKFIFCPDSSDPTALYAAMEDKLYVDSSEMRRQQSVEILEQVQKVGDFSSWLDIGAGVGELVDVVNQSGVRGIGIEPSHFLSAAARKLKRNVLTGSLEAIPNEKFDVISLVDVIEHVLSPLKFLDTLIPYLNPKGIIVIVTPDSDSVVAKLLKRRWWHIRPAHISYFSQETLRKLMVHLSLEELGHFRPSWYFPGAYLSQRLGKYLGVLSFIIKPISYVRIIKVNPRDSIGIIARVKT